MTATKLTPHSTNTTNEVAAEKSCDSEQAIITTEAMVSKDRFNRGLLESKDFDQLVKERVKNRKEKDEYNIAKLRVQMTQLENSLSAEIKRRVASQRQLEQTCQQQVAAVEERLIGIIDQQSRDVELRMQLLEDRMQELQKQVDRVSTDIPKLVESQSQQVSQQLNRLTQDVQQEKKERFTREGILLKQIQDYEKSINEAIEQERSQTQTKLEHLRDMLETNESGRVEADTRFASLMEQELTMLKNQLQMEMEQRQAEDDAIVDAMNRYTTKLQATLTAITSDE